MKMGSGAALGTAWMLMACAATAQEPQPPMHAAMHEMPRTIHVTGTGTAEREPDRAVLIVAVETQAQTARAAAQQNAERANAVIAALRRAGIPQNRIRTVDYNLYPDYRHDPERGQAELIGYRAVNRVEAVIENIQTVGGVIDAAIEAGANRVESLQFGLSDPDAARREALADAVANARASAEVLARAAGVSLGSPMHISTAYEPPVVPYGRPEMLMRADAGAPTPVETGALTVRATVNIAYRID